MSELHPCFDQYRRERKRLIHWKFRKRQIRLRCPADFRCLKTAASDSQLLQQLECGLVRDSTEISSQHLPVCRLLGALDAGNYSFNFSKGSGHFMGVNLDAQLACNLRRRKYSQQGLPAILSLANNDGVGPTV